jgi:MprA protease rhombosortase-interaction domain-containing protein
MSGVGIGLLFAGAMCVLGSLVSPQVAAIVAGILLASGVVAFALRRASLLVDEIIEPDRQHQS